jgi:hypothetical protein
MQLELGQVAASVSPSLIGDVRASMEVATVDNY